MKYPRDYIFDYIHNNTLQNIHDRNILQTKRYLGNF